MEEILSTVRKLALLAALAASASTAPALAQTADPAPVENQQPSLAVGPVAAEDGVTFSGGVTFTTDYVPRGFSLNDREGALQGFIEGAIPVTDDIKLFGGVWASSLDKDVLRGGSEVDPYVGLAGDLGEGRGWKVTYLRITFPDAPVEQDFNEYTASYTQPIGPVIGTIFVLYDDYDVGDSTMVTASGVYPIPNSAFSLKAVLGYEDGINWDDKVHWSVGGQYDFKGMTFSLAYVDTNRFQAKSDNPTENVADGNFVFSVSKSF